MSDSSDLCNWEASVCLCLCDSLGSNWYDCVIGMAMIACVYVIHKSVIPWPCVIRAEVSIFD